MLPIPPSVRPDVRLADDRHVHGGAAAERCGALMGGDPDLVRAVTSLSPRRRVRPMKIGDDRHLPGQSRGGYGQALWSRVSRLGARPVSESGRSTRPQED